MKFYLFILSFICWLPAVCQEKTFVLYNPAPLARLDELIILKKKDLIKKVKGLDVKKYITITDIAKQPQQLQFDDLDKDGSWDEVIFLHSFKPYEKAVFSVLVTDKEPENKPMRAHVRQRRKNADDTFGPGIPVDSIPAGQLNTNFSKAKLPPFLTEGPAWENDMVGFRLYFDIRNGKDIWGKTTKAMMMDTVGVNPAVIYHNKASWGMDIYKVGSSLSAGALALSLKLASGKDSLIRLGGVNMGKVIYEQIADGPLRATFRLHYPEWKFANGYNPISLTEEISIWGGQYYYQSHVIVENMPKNANLVTGFANLYGLKSNEIIGKHFKALYSYGLQSENKDNLGLAVVIPNQLLKSFKQTSSSEKDVKDSYLAYFQSKKEKPGATFRFYACWQASDYRFSDLTGFNSFLNEQLKLADQPINLNWK